MSSSAYGNAQDYYREILASLVALIKHSYCACQVVVQTDTGVSSLRPVCICLYYRNQDKENLEGEDPSG